MMEPWFDPNHYAWIPGTVYGVAAGVMGSLVGLLVPRGRARGPLLRAWYSLWALAIVFLVVGILALRQGQPWGVWFGFLLPGALGTVVVGANSLVILRAYQKVEERRLSAKDLV